MEPNVLVSIIINNYNYEQYLRSAIESALEQRYPNTEVIVVDDGSTDNSASILNEYKAKVEVILKENGGQGSAFNAGFAACKGDIIIFLDADDCMLPETTETVVKTFDKDDIAKVQWRLRVIDEDGNPTGNITPDKKLLSGNLLGHVIARGSDSYLSPPTSGNAWSRKFLENVMPMPDAHYRISADNYLCMLAPLYGNIQTIEQPLALYRLHGNNNYRGKTLDEALLNSKVERFEQGNRIVIEHLQILDLDAEINEWNRHSWLKKLHQAIDDIKKVVAEAAGFILVDDNQWQVQHAIAGRTVILFKENDSTYWGPPADDADAISEIEKNIKQGIKYIFFAWPSFWQLDHYKEMVNYLHDNFVSVIDDERLKGYRLKEGWS